MEMQNVNERMPNWNGDDARKVENLRSPPQHERRSCDACRQKKKRCDQEQPCSRCVRSQIQCRYSKRRWNHPDCPVERHQGCFRERCGDAVHAPEDSVHSAAGALVNRRMLPLKRCSLRASPATGFVGMRENAFISDFFGCVGFLPLANERQIREAMVKIMVSAVPQQEPVESTDCDGENGHVGTLFGWGTSNNASGMDHFPKDPSLAAFWAAVAVGALSKGSPFEAVEFYAQLAREALTACHSDSTNAELARASALLTYLYSFMGDAAKFREYGELSEYFLRASIEQGTIDKQSGLFYLVLHCRKVGNSQVGANESSWFHEEAPLQLDGISNERDVYRFVAQSFTAFDRSIYAQGRERCSGDIKRFYSCGPSQRNSSPDDPLPGEVSAAIMAVFETTNALDFEPLQHAADRPGIRSGTGDLLINGTLVFSKAAKGDLFATLEKLDRSIEVYERYPGLCRGIMGSHMLHGLIATLASISDFKARRMYDRLRGVFNSCRVPHSKPIPPIDEWQGVAAVCSDLHCRVIEAVVTGQRKKAAAAHSIDSVHDSSGLAKAARNPRREVQREALPSAVAHGEIVEPVQACPCSSGSGSNATDECAENQEPIRGRYCAGIALAPNVSRSDPRSQQGAGSDNAHSLEGVATKSFDLSPRSARIAEHREDHVQPKSEEIGEADWLEAAHAMSDAVHAA